MEGNVISLNEGIPRDRLRSLRRPWPSETPEFPGAGPTSGRGSRAPEVPSPAQHLGGLRQVSDQTRGALWRYHLRPPPFPLPAPQPGSGEGVVVRTLQAHRQPRAQGSQSTRGRLPPRTPTCRPRMRSARLARPASPRPAARGQCAGAAADASVYVRARRWRRRG